MILENFDREKKSIIKNAIVNDYDEYSWSELNCIYRPFAIALNSFNKGTFEIFLMLITFIHGYTLDSSFKCTPYSKDHPVFDLYDKYLKKIFLVDIRIEEFFDENELHSKLINNIAYGNLVIIPEDIYELYYSPAFRQTNDSHFFIVKGYDLDRKIYYILDNLHNDAGVSTSFSDFAVEFTTIYKLVNAYNKNIDSSNNMYFWTLTKLKQKNIENVIHDAFQFMTEFIARIQKEELKIKFPERILISDYMQDINSYYFNERIFAINQRNVYYNSLIKNMSLLNSDSSLLKDIKEIVSNQKKEFNLVKNLILYNYQKRNKDFSTINDKINNLEFVEKKLLSKINVFICEYNIIKIVQDSPYIIKNLKNCYYEMNDNNINIFHKDDIINDLWTLTDNAWQLLYQVSNRRFELEVSVEADCINMSPIHCGIIVIIDGKRILFGNLQNHAIAIEDVDCGDDSKIEICKVPLINQKCVLRLSYQDNTINFYVKNPDISEFNYVFTYNTNKRIEQIGFFSKTWEKVNNHVVFSELRVNNRTVKFSDVII